MNRLNQDFQIELTLGANATEVYDFNEDREKDDYVPFRNCYIFNDNVGDLDVYLNRNKQARYIPRSSNVALEDKRISRLKITNRSASSVTVIINLNNDYSELELLKYTAGIHER
jgi:hypothetical protein